MEIVIKIPDRLIKKVKDHYVNPYEVDEICEAILNGTPLPKEHGRLIILSEAIVKENQMNLDFSCQKWISEVGLSNATVAIIKADKESEECR